MTPLHQPCLQPALGTSVVSWGAGVMPCRPMCTSSTGEPHSIPASDHPVSTLELSAVIASPLNYLHIFPTNALSAGCQLCRRGIFPNKTGRFLKAGVLGSSPRHTVTGSAHSESTGVGEHRSGARSHTDGGGAGGRARH